MVWGYPVPRIKASLRSVTGTKTEVIVRSYSQNLHCGKTSVHHLGDQAKRVIISTITIVQLSFFQILGFFLSHLVLCSWCNAKKLSNLAIPCSFFRIGSWISRHLSWENSILLFLGTFASAIPSSRLSFLYLWYSISVFLSPSVSSQKNRIAQRSSCSETNW